MSEWLSLQEVLITLDIKDFEIFTYLKNGLQPYEKGGKVPLKCPFDYHEYKFCFEQPPKLNPHTQKELSDFYKKRLSDIVNDDPEAISWKYLIVPESPDENNVLISLLSRAYFKKEDIKALVREHKEQILNSNADTPIESTHQKKSSDTTEPQNQKSPPQV